MTIIAPPNRFVGLHCHSGFSVNDGLGYPDRHIDFVLQNGMDAWALTDHGSGNGLAHAHTYAKKMKGKGRKYRQLYGVEFYFVPSLLDWEKKRAAHFEAKRAKNEEGKPEKTDILAEEEVTGGLVVEDEEETKTVDADDADEWKRRYHLVVFAKNRTGLKNLFNLVKRSYVEGYYKFPRIDYNMLKQHGEGLVVSTACVGGLLASTSIRGEALKKSPEQIQRELQNHTDKFVDAVGIDNFFLELQFNKLDIQHTTNKHLIELSKRTGIKTIATADSHYYSPNVWQARELYKKLGRMGGRSDDMQKQTLPAFEELKCELYPKNAQQMWDEYLAHKDQYDFYKGTELLVKESIERTHDIAWEKCEEVTFDSSAKLPSFNKPEQSAFNQLLDMCKKGLVELGLHTKPEYVERLKMELDDIKYLKFENYFLTLYYVFDRAQHRTLIGPGRGSGAGSLVNYVLGITSVDPIKYDLLWERFLGRHKVAWPDIDTDVGDRDVLIDEARNLFGEDSVVPVSNFNTLKLKSLIKDIAKFHGIPFEEVNEVTGPLQDDVMHKALGDHEEKSTYVLSHADCMKYSEKYKIFMEKYPELCEQVQSLFMETRSIGRHAGGVLICPKLEDHMPVISVRGEIQTPWSEGMNFRHLEENGFLKFDFLGLSLLKMVEDCIRMLLQTRHGIKEPTFAQIKEFFDKHLNIRYNEPDDQEVWKHVYHEGRFTQVFQFTNSGARKFCLEAKPTSIEDLSAITAIYRPGPLAAGVHKKYVDVKNKGSATYKHPILKDILGPTHGFVVYQEQFMLLAQKLAGFNPGESDQMRKTLVKKSLDMNEKKAKEREDLRKRFVDGAVNLNGMSVKDATELYETIEAFSAYGFNKSHSVSYAVDSYYAAWLHKHYEEEWLATCLQSENSNPEGLAKVATEIKEQGFKIHPPNINSSGLVWMYSHELQGFVPPLSSIKGVGDTAVKEIMENRPYRDVEHMLYNDAGEWRHSKVNKTALSSLCSVEAFSSLEDFRSGKIKNHRQFLATLTEGKNYDILRRGRFGYTKTEMKKLLKEGREPEVTIWKLFEDFENLPDWSRSEKLKMYFDLTSTSREDLMFPENIIAKIKKAQVNPITSLDDGERQICWFLIQDFNIKKTKNGKNFIRAQVCDSDMQTVNLRIWGDMNINQYEIYIAEVSKDPNWGFSTNANKMRKIEV
jgi:DNA polymerase-3 subunit alpha